MVIRNENELALFEEIHIPPEPILYGDYITGKDRWQDKKVSQAFRPGIVVVATGLELVTTQKPA